MNARAVGRHAPRPSPARNRRMVNVATSGANATAMVSTENTAMLVIRQMRRPYRSDSGPMATAPIPTPISPTVEAMVSDELVKPRSPVLDSTGMTAPSTTRSNPSSATAIQHRTTGHKPECVGVWEVERGTGAADMTTELPRTMKRPTTAYPGVVWITPERRSSAAVAERRLATLLARRSGLLEVVGEQ